MTTELGTQGRGSPEPARRRNRVPKSGSWFLALLCWAWLVPVPVVDAQEWNSPAATALAARATEARRVAQRDSTLRSYRTVAHGFVFFLAQVGDQLQAPPRLVKADELEVEVYWRAPDVSKQVILGWRDGRWLPTDINYHRDHLGIVTNNFGDRIRIGEGDEVRDVVHPLSPAGLDQYDFALMDSVLVQSQGREMLLQQLQVRPRDWNQPLVLGTLSLDSRTAELVSFRFSFTPSAYLDPQLEDISIELENARFEDRWWLPYRQEIEIRRRARWFDFPVRGIIRGRWELGDYQFDAAVPPSVVTGRDISGLRQPNDSSYPWSNSLPAAVGGLAGTPEWGLDSLRREVAGIAGSRVLSGLAAERVGGGAVSDLIRVNRVQGLALGIGGAVGLGESGVEVRPRIGFGTSDDRVTGGLALVAARGHTAFEASGGRSITDFGDIPVISGVLNSVLAQEVGKDFGDYVMVDRIGLEVRHGLSTRTSLTVGARYEDAHSVAVEASPTSGTYRPNPALGAGDVFIGHLTLRAPSSWALALEAGTGEVDYVRATARGTATAPAGPGRLRFDGFAGWGSAELPAYRSFAIGGRGTLVGEPFRAFGGRSTVLAHMEWDFPVPFIAVPLGSFASTGNHAMVGPFVAAGWTDRAVRGTPWVASSGVRPVAGLAGEFFMGLLRVEAGVALRTGDIGVTADVSRAWWGIL